MRIGPLHFTYPTKTFGHDPVKALRVAMDIGEAKVLFDTTTPAALQQGVFEQNLDTIIYTSTQASVLQQMHQLEELGQNPDWQRSGMFVQMREDGTLDGEDGWYAIKAVDVSEDFIFSSYAEPKIDIVLRARRKPEYGVFVDAKAVVNGAGLTGTTMAAFPQGVGSGYYPQATYSLAGADGSTINIVEAPPTALRCPFVDPVAQQTLGRCGVFDATYDDTTSTEVFYKDHRYLNQAIKITNQLLRYTIALSNPNLLTLNQAGFESSQATGWQAVQICTIATAQVNVHSGAWSLAITSNAAGTLFASTLKAINNIGYASVQGGQTYTAFIWLRARGTARTAHVGVDWYDINGNSLSGGLNATGVSVGGSWTQIGVTGAAPTGAYYADIYVQIDGIAASGEIFDLDDTMLAQGTISGSAVQATRGQQQSPLIEVWSGSAWVLLGNYQIAGAVSNVNTAVQGVTMGVISPEEVVWEERRYDNQKKVFCRVINRIRRGSRLIESQIVAAAGEALNTTASIGIVGMPAATYASNSSADSTGAIATGGPSIAPGFATITAATVNPFVNNNGYFTGAGPAANAYAQIAIICGYQDAMYTSVGTAALNAAKWASYNRNRVKQRILVG
jgi:hypothetical protein